MGALRVERDGDVLRVALARPERRNAFDAALIAELTEAFGDVGDARAVVLTGEGASFCAGADFRATPGVAGGAGDALPAERSFATYEPFLEVFELEVPTIAALNGHAVGGGFGLALVCDLRIANREAKYGANFARLGFHSGMAISHLLPRIVGVPTAADLLFTGRLVTGEEAAALGLVNVAVEPARVAGVALDKARAVAGAAPLAVRLMKRSLYTGVGWDPRAAAWQEALAQSATLATEDAREGIRALLEKREARFTGR
jgi:enoyl-CoA hydratase/carnithine racemase